jgi:hypothetical protein
MAVDFDVVVDVFCGQPQNTSCVAKRFLAFALLSGVTLDLAPSEDHRNVKAIWSAA